MNQRYPPRGGGRGGPRRDYGSDYQYESYDDAAPSHHMRDEASGHSSRRPPYTTRGRGSRPPDGGYHQPGGYQGGSQHQSRPPSESYQRGGGKPPRGRGRGSGSGGGSTSSGYSNHKHSSAAEIQFCKFHTFDGTCRFGDACWDSHDLRLLAKVPEAHEGGIYCVATSQSSEGNIDLYTGSKDSTLRSWRVTPSTTSGSGSLECTMLTVTPCHSEVTSCIYAQDCLFCGLASGLIRMFHKPTGVIADLVGHQHEVHSLLVIDNVLASGDWGGQIKLWQFCKTSNTFETTHTVEVEAPIKCMAEVQMRQDPQQPPTRLLWVGCSGCLVIVDLLNLSVSRRLKLASRQIAMGILTFDEHIVVSLLTGEYQVYTASGDLVSTKELKGSVCSTAAALGPTGPLLLSGLPNGYLSARTVPSFKDCGNIHAHNQDVRVVTSLGSDDPALVLTASMDGTFCIWRWRRD